MYDIADLHATVTAIAAGQTSGAPFTGLNYPPVFLS
jgi:hypothetical protein